MNSNAYHFPFLNPPHRARSVAGFLLSCLLCILCIVSPGGSTNATVFEPREFDDPILVARYRTLIEELRCLVCQNQSLADSNAELAADLRQEVYRMVSDGADEEAVKSFMVSRYSEYVLYRPPVTMVTLLLWLGPLLFVLAGFVFLVFRVRHRANSIPPPPLSGTEQESVEKLLGR
uniref:Cytochrome c-type biogenesis protein n=1 Tax=Candidatus Kentrum sp. DK TaxID=2126562 RepID=A0A450SSA8_9GAMM|nr:MAG: cytochrome c-type biogenesis protein CcmH [Candidatus Kentron sp. DK]